MKREDASRGPSEDEAAARPPLLVIVGPTASGKSTLAALMGRRLAGEVVSADSVQVYRHFNIGAGKPTPDELALCPHHLIDVVEPEEVMEAHVWAQLAREKIAEIRQRGRVPILCGGTFLWVRALIYGLAEAPPADSAVRERHRQLEAQWGRAHLHKLLEEVDEPSAQRLHENDFVRVSRALEVFEISGKRLSDLQREHGFRRPRYDTKMLTLDFTREEYDERVKRRVSGMLEAGFIEETRRLLELGYEHTRAMSSVGYRQVRDWLRAASAPPVSELATQIVQVTRVFARRQRTWLRDEAVRKMAPGALLSSGALDEELERLGVFDFVKEGAKRAEFDH